jgi:hypothetical protein
LVAAAGVLEVEQVLVQVKVVQEATQLLQATLLVLVLVLETLGVVVVTVVGAQ